MLGGIVVGWLVNPQDELTCKVRVRPRHGSDEVQYDIPDSNQIQMYVITDEGSLHIIRVSMVQTEIEKHRLRNAGSQDFRGLSRLNRKVILSLPAQSLDINPSGILLYSQKTLAALLAASENYVRALLPYLTVQINDYAAEKLLAMLFQLSGEISTKSWFDRLYWRGIPLSKLAGTDEFKFLQFASKRQHTTTSLSQLLIITEDNKLNPPYHIVVDTMEELNHATSLCMTPSIADQIYEKYVTYPGQYVFLFIYTKDSILYESLKKGKEYNLPLKDVEALAAA